LIKKKNFIFLLIFEEFEHLSLYLILSKKTPQLLIMLSSSLSFKKTLENGLKISMNHAKNPQKTQRW